MTTVRELISSSLRLITVIGAGETMTAEDANDGLKTLNQMLESWSADGSVINSKSVDTISLTAGDAVYTMGTGGDFNTTRPAIINFVTVKQGDSDYPLNVWGAEVYATVENKVIQGQPTDVYVDNGSSLLTFTLSPVPYGGLTMSVYSEKPLSALTLDSVLSLPPGYEKAIRYNLSCELAPEYEREASATVQRMAHESLMTIKRNNMQYSDATSAVDAALDTRYTSSGPGGYNIYRGY